MVDETKDYFMSHKHLKHFQKNNNVCCKINLVTFNVYSITPGPVHFFLSSIVALLTLGAHAQRGLQYSVCVSVCLSVYLSVTTLQASVVYKTLKFRHQRSADDTLECFDSWILLTMLASRDIASFVSQEAYERASLPETSSARDQSVALNLDRTRALFSRDFLVRFCVSEAERFTVGELSHLPKSSSKPLCKACCPGRGGMVHLSLKGSGHVFVANHNKHLLTPSRKHTLRSFGAIVIVEKAVDQLTKSLLSQEKSIRN